MLSVSYSHCYAVITRVLSRTGEGLGIFLFLVNFHSFLHSATSTPMHKKLLGTQYTYISSFRQRLAARTCCCLFRTFWIWSWRCPTTSGSAQILSRARTLSAKSESNFSAWLPRSVLHSDPTRVSSLSLRSLFRSLSPISCRRKPASSSSQLRSRALSRRMDLGATRLKIFSKKRRTKTRPRWPTRPWPAWPKFLSPAEFFFEKVCTKMFNASWCQYYKAFFSP